LHLTSFDYHPMFDWETICVNTAEALTWLGTITGAVGAATGISSLGISFWTIRRDRPQLVAKLQHGYKVSEMPATIAPTTPTS